ncbi:hypothetical protein ACFXPW_07425 [Streptomyces goshikiensis]|uniref:hypothetical protein n=1 Tax=Streptomyces goshikiensis TaxID=1942 RepID=UPI00367B245E
MYGTPSFGCFTVLIHARTCASNSCGVVPAHERANASSRVDTTCGSCVATPSKDAWSRSVSALYGPP